MLICLSENTSIVDCEENNVGMKSHNVCGYRFYAYLNRFIDFEEGENKIKVYIFL